MAQPEKIEEAQKEILVIDVLKRQIIRILFMYLLVSNVFVFLRMLLRMFGADPQNAFAGFIFFVSGIILLPFFNIFPQSQETIIAGEQHVDSSAFIAIFCSNILILLAICLIYIVTRMIKTRKQTNEAVETSKPVDAEEAEAAVD